MYFVFELSGEHPDLPRAEAVACLDAESIEYNVIDVSDQILVVDTNLNSKQLEQFQERIALCHAIHLELFNCDCEIDEIMDFAKKSTRYHWDKKGTFCIRAKRIGKWYPELSLSMVQRMLGAILGKKKVDLTNPDIEVRVLISNKCWVGITQKKINRTAYEDRKPQHRPFFSPISLHPKFARALVNLSRIKKGDKILDPFCGTGGILIEAGLIGAKITFSYTNIDGQ